MNKNEIIKRLKDLESNKFINFHFIDGNIYSCPPENIDVYFEDKYIEALNTTILFQNLSYMDSWI